MKRQSSPNINRQQKASPHLQEDHQRQPWAPHASARHSPGARLSCSNPACSAALLTALGSRKAAQEEVSKKGRSLPAAPAADDHQKACFDSGLFAAEPTTARRQCVVVGVEGTVTAATSLLLKTFKPSRGRVGFVSLPVTGRSEKAGLTGTVDSTWLPVVGQKVGSGHRCLVHTSVMILEPAKQAR